jgi:hypothetical protein
VWPISWFSTKIRNPEIPSWNLDFFHLWLLNWLTIFMIHDKMWTGNVKLDEQTHLNINIYTTSW